MTHVAPAPQPAAPRRAPSRAPSRAASRPASDGTARASGRPAALRRVRPAVVVLDPDPAMRHFCARLLTRSGEAVLTARGTDDAARLLAAYPDTVGAVVLPRYLAEGAGRAGVQRLARLAPGAALVYTGPSRDTAPARGRPPGAGDTPPADGLVQGDRLARTVARALEDAGARPAHGGPDAAGHTADGR